MGIVAHLRSAAADNTDLSFHGAGGIGRNPSGESDGRKDRASIGDAVPKRHVSRFIHGNTAHPPIAGVRRKCTLLGNRGSAAGILDFVPAHAAT